jgi:hypothetical protein
MQGQLDDARTRTPPGLVEPGKLGAAANRGDAERQQGRVTLLRSGIA